MPARDIWLAIMCLARLNRVHYTQYNAVVNGRRRRTVAGFLTLRCCRGVETEVDGEMAVEAEVGE